MANKWNTDIPGKFVYTSWNIHESTKNTGKIPDPETIQRRVFSPYIMSLRCWGLLYVDNENLPLKMGASKLYHCVMVVLLAINFFRYFGVYSIGLWYPPALQDYLPHPVLLGSDEYHDWPDHQQDAANHK